MPCYFPLEGWRSHARNPSGKRSIVFQAKLADRDMPVTIPCGQCIGCRLERARQWAVRCVHEASLYDFNQFVTLTYAPEHMPAGGTLVKRDFQLFMKKLRKATPEKIRYFHCGEYGEKLGRPHYHACIFNLELPDRELWKRTPAGDLFTSARINEAWGKGYSVVGDVTFDSAAYVARYIVGKITGEAAEAHYAGRLPEYTTMSRRPGIGKGWYDLYSRDTYPRDSIVIRGREMKPPKFYDGKFELDSPSEFADLKRKRKAQIDPLDPENSPARQAVKAEVQRLNLSALKRS